MIKLDRLLPGELDGDVDPRDYGFDVIEDEFTEREKLDGMIELYLQARERTGITLPKMERLIGQQAMSTAVRAEKAGTPHESEPGGGE